MNRPNSYLLVRFSFFVVILCVNSLFVYVCFCCVRFSLLRNMPRDWPERTSLEMTYLHRVGRKNLNSINLGDWTMVAWMYFSAVSFCALTHLAG